MKTETSKVGRRCQKSVPQHLGTSYALVLLVLAMPLLAEAQFTYTTNQGTIITKYVGSNSVVTIPSAIEGLPVVSIKSFLNNQVTAVSIADGVTNIAGEAFLSCAKLNNVTIPRSLASLGFQAFIGCPILQAIYFEGNAPNVGQDVFFGDTNATVYYVPGTTGWSTTFAGRPTAPWHPKVQTTGPSFGVRSNQFGFNVNWASGMVIVIDTSTDLVHPNWSPLQTNTLTGSIYFSDPHWTNFTNRFYRVRSP